MCQTGETVKAKTRLLIIFKNPEENRIEKQRRVKRLVADA